MQAVIDREGCIGCTLCAQTCPSVFRMADDGKAEAVAAITGDLADDAQSARDICPVSVISLSE